MKAGNYTLSIRDKEGFDLLAPESYWLASDEVIAEYTGGCGPGKIGDWLVPDTMLGESVFLACQIHDWMYHCGITAEDKRIADKVFLWNMVALIDDGEFLDTIRLRTVMAYYQAVSKHGGSSFSK